MTGSEKLATERQELFAKNVAEGMTPAVAFKVAGYGGKGGEGHRLLRQAKVAARVRWLKGEEKAPDPEAGSVPLANARREVFAQEIAKGTGMVEVSRILGNAETGWPGWRLKGTEEVRARILWLQRAAAEGAVLSIVEKRAFLRMVVVSAPGDVGAQDGLCQEVVMTRRTRGRGEAAEEWETVRVKLPDKLRAIALDNELSGDGAAAGNGSGDGKVMTLADELAVIRAKTRGRGMQNEE